MMRGIVAFALAIGCQAGNTLSAQQRPLSVYISADMEGISGLSSTDDPLGPRFMTREVNAAIAGAFNAGAVRVVVNDAHGSHTNLLQDQLDPRVTLIRGALKPFGMMQGLDSSFSAVLFVGFHGKANSPGGFAAHTGSGIVADLRINGASLGEGGMNTLYAAWYGVPVAFIGLAGYLVLLGLALAVLQTEGVVQRRLLTIGFLLALGGVGFSAYLTYIEVYVIEAICIWCVTYEVSLLLRFLIALIVYYRQPKPEPV